MKKLQKLQKFSSRRYSETVIHNNSKHFQIIIPYRGEASETLRLRLCGDLGQVLFLPYYLKDEENLDKAVKYSNVVINLVGCDWETKNFKFDDVHVKGARAIARAAKKAGVERLIHFSALNANPHPEPIFLKNGSGFLSSKYHGEAAVLEEFPEATIFRPADIYGQEDRFLRYVFLNSNDKDMLVAKYF